MPTTLLSDQDTAERLVRAAERLFAERGVGAVSLRAVMQAAGTNVASVHYHFGSKTALVEAVVSSRMEVVSAGRDALVEQLAGADARGLARAFVQPIADLVHAGAGAWVQVIGQLLATNDPALSPISASFFDRNARFVELLGQLDASASPATIGFRLTQAMTVTLQVLGDVEVTRSLLTGDGPAWTDEEVVEQLLDVVTAILAGPST
ncbi:MAG: TetR family transcriptional regulator [Marmoricola sp.]